MPYKDPEDRKRWQRDHNRQLREQWLAENGPCKMCSSTLDLQVDHIDRNVKTSHKVWSWSESKRLAELAKCQVLCRSCHQKKTNQENNKPIQHGTHSAHAGRGCRCDLCVEAHRIYKAEWRKRKLLNNHG